MTRDLEGRQMPSNYKIQVFGKPGCDKCAVLNQRLDKLLAEEQWRDFEKEYCSLDTEDGLVAFAESECINPNRIPALIVKRLNSGTGEYEPMPAPPAMNDDLTRRTSLRAFLGLQTDYGEAGRGVLSPKTLEWVLREAAGQTAPA
jgi:hypothetical protein